MTSSRTMNCAPLSRVLGTFVLLFGFGTGEQEITFPMLMPDAKPTQSDTYFCTSFKMPPHDQYIVAFAPNASADTVHHFRLTGCDAPGLDTPRAIWDCGMMDMDTNSTVAPVCAEDSLTSVYMYGWALGAPKMGLPEGVGFKVGGSTGINYLVLQIHYSNVEKFQSGATDNSGVILTMVDGDTKRVTKRAGVLTLIAGGSIPAHSIEHMETSCRIEEPLVLYPFAVHPHTHKLGTVVSGWMVDSENKWHLLGRHDPQKPQMFYPVEDKNLTIHEGDIVAARCTINNTLDHIVHSGYSKNDEMCNFHMMYYVEGDRTLEDAFCRTRGPPLYYWKDDEMLGDIPQEVDKEASRL